MRFNYLPPQSTLHHAHTSFCRSGSADHGSTQSGLCFFSVQPTCCKEKKKKKTFHNRLTKALRSSFLPTSHPYFFFVRFTLPHPRKKFPPTPNINFLALSAHSKAAHATFPVSRHALIWLQSSRVAGKYQTKWCSWDQLHDRKWRFNSGTYVAAYSRSYFSACLQAV